MEDVDTRVPLSLHPDNIAALDGVDDDTRVFIAPATEALTAAHVYLASIYDYREAAFSDPTLTEPAALLKTDDYAMAKLEGVTRQMDGAIARFTTTIKSLESDLSASVKEQAGKMVSGEVRALMQKSPDRVGLLEKAVGEKDLDVLSAVCGAPPMLSGLSKEMHAHFTRLYNEMTKPEATKRLKALTAARSYLERHGPQVLKESIKAVGVIQIPIPGPDGKTLGYRTEGPDAYRRKRNASAKVYRQHA
ncbi:hypothetical protein [Defluviimonas sp. SAOS-178_SWC]|uniref:hypothetical protein n=1 Tax=Defluviimonas sp. SAOS-178_SWC TaxID=3121287 RepID=UPI003221C579